MMRKAPFVQKKVWLIVTFLVMLVAVSANLFAGTTGKIAGTVTDKQTGEPIPGANVVVEGTNLGASTDAQGRYFILNVPVGVYTVRVSFIGYKVVRNEDVRVSVDLTTTVDFQVETTVIEGEEVVVLAERPLVEKSLTASAAKYSTAELNNTLPVANFNDIVNTAPSVYRGYVRGGKKYETKTLVDGVDISDSYYSGGTGAYGGETGHSYQSFRTSDENDNTGVQVVSGAVEEVTVFAGTFNAEYPSATAGIINVVTKEGSQHYTGSFFNRTLATSGLRHAGTSVYTDYPSYAAERDQLAAGNPTAQRRAALYTWSPDEARQSYNYDPADSTSIGRSTEMNFTLSGPLTSKGGFFFEGNYSNQLGPLPFDKTKKIGGSLKAHYNLSGNKKITAMFQLTDGGELFNFVNWKFNPRWKYNMNAAPRYKDLSTLAYLKWTNALNARTFYEVQISRTTQLSKIGYPDDNGDGFPTLDESGDFIAFKDMNEYIKYVGGNGTRGSENGYVYGDTSFSQPVFFSSQLDPGGTFGDLNKPDYPVGGIKTGGFYRTAYPPPLYYRTQRDKYSFKVDLTSQVTYNHQIKTGLNYSVYNVDVDSKQSEIYGAGVEYPTSKMHTNIFNFHPKELAFYAQDRIEFQGLIVNVGARVDGYDTDTENFVNDFDPLTEVKNSTQELLTLQPNRGDNVGMRFFFSPRLGVSHPVTDNLAMHYSFGRFFQYPNFATLYQDYNFTAYSSSPSIQTVRTDQEPIRSTAYEMGAQYSVKNMYLLNVTAYYRDVENYRSASYTLTTAENRGLIFTTTWGYADARGIEIELSKRPGKWWGGRLAYAYSYVKESVGAGGTFKTAFATKADSVNYAGLPWDELDRYPSFERNVLVNSNGTNTLAGGYDRPHRLSGSLLLFFPFQVNATFVGEWTSGFYFQQLQNINDDPFFTRSRNLRTGPSTFYLNARLAKTVNFSKLGIEVFAEVRNLTDRSNIRSIAPGGFNNTTNDLSIWELGRDLKANTGDELSDPEGVFQMPTDVFGRLYYLNAREYYVGLNINFN